MMYKGRWAAVPLFCKTIYKTVSDFSDGFTDGKEILKGAEQIELNNSVVTIGSLSETCFCTRFLYL